MLLQLTVANYAIAEKLELQFDRGMTALTGETGAGKSIVLEALALALGGRADAGAVRAGAKRADITAVFDLSDNPEAKNWLENQDLDAEDDCLLRRVIGRDGRSRSYINGRPCPLQALRELGGLLMDIHSQHQHQSLLRSDNHRRLLDEFAAAEPLALQVKEVCQQWRTIRDRLEDLRGRKSEQDARLQLLRYQVEELQRLDLGEQELEALEAEQRQLSHAEKVLQHSHSAAQICSEDEVSASDLVRQAIQQIEQIPVELPALTESLQMLQDARIQLEEAGDTLRRFIEGYELDPQRLVQVEERLSALYQLARKHQVQPEDLPGLRHRLEAELDELETGGSSLEELAAELDRLEDRYRGLAAELSGVRTRAASLLDEKICQELQRLNMADACFVTRLNAHEDGLPRPQGNEDVEFLISTNPGQPPRALAKTASGGELSRISLAIQVVVAQTSTIPTLVFDEVDVGIGGGTAEVVGRLLRLLGETGQVICVTHLPQVAAQGHQHLFVSKFSQDEATFSQVEKLDDRERVQEVARMLGGLDLTEPTLAHAREMLTKGQATRH